MKNILTYLKKIWISLTRSRKDDDYECGYGWPKGGDKDNIIDEDND